MTSRRALITGITGQDGSYLAELLLQKGYSVIGVTSGKSDRHRLASIGDRIELIEGDVTDEAFVRRILTEHTPDEVYNLASVATVAEPWKDVPDLARIVALTPLYFLEGIRSAAPRTRFFQASSSEMYGAPENSPQSERTPLAPQNPYGVAKTFAHSMVQGYRANHGLYAVAGILFSHESPRRKETFVTRKIALSLAKIELGLQDFFELGNLDARRDWGFAGDYVDAMWRMMQQEKPDDYVIATGTTHTVREFVVEAARVLGMKIVFEGSGVDEVGKNAAGDVILKIHPSFYRPAGEKPVCGDPSRARAELGWEPRVTFAELVAMMVEADRAALRGASKK